MGFLKKMIKNVAGNVIGDYLPDSITGTVADELINEAAGDVVDKAVDKTVDKAADSLRRNPLRTPPPPAVPAPAESLSVLVAVNGTTYGPYEKATLIEMIQQGSLTRDTYVYIEGMSEWRPAGQVAKVAALFAPQIPRPAAPPVPWANPAPAAPAATPAAGNSNGFSEKLNALIASAVADGEISDLERQVLIRNAQAEGVAMDEFVMVLEARLYERRQELSRMQKQEQSAAEAAKLAAMRAAAPAPSPSPQKRNTLDRCPLCNAPVKQLATSCPKCGYEYPVGMAGNQGTASERHARKIEEARETAENAPKKGKLNKQNIMQNNPRKCPECGALLEAYATRCGSCGYDLQNVQASQSVVSFAEKLDEIEASRPQSQKSDKDVGFGTIVLGMFFYWILLPIKAFKMLTKKDESDLWCNIDTREENLVVNFPIPVAKSEILEFTTLAASHIMPVSAVSTLKDEAKYKLKWNKIWMSKLEQINTKANIAMKEDPKALAEIKCLVDKAKATIQQNDKNQKIMLAICVGLPLLTLILLMILPLIIYGGGH